MPNILNQKTIMAPDPDLDDVAFLSGAEENARQAKKSIVCSQKRALCIAGLVCTSLLTTALIVAYGAQPSACSCSMQKSLSESDANSSIDSIPFKPIATNGDPFPWLLMNLPTFVKPLSYMITIHPNLTTYDIKGQVTIELNILEETQFIIIHAQNLNVTERAITVSGNRGQSVKIVRLLDYPPRQQLYIEFKEKLKKKYNYTLNLRWYSRLNIDPDGFYIDHFENMNGVQRSLAATVFHTNGARKYFPCFNEPQHRTPFRISIFRDRFHIGLSNSNVHKTEDVGFYMGTGLLRDDFKETPQLSPDSIGWVISDFKRQSLDVETTQTSRPISEISKENSTKPTVQNKKKVAVRSIASLTQSLNLKALPANNSHSALSSQINKMPKNDSSLQTGETISYTFYAPEDLLVRANLIMKTAKDVLLYLESWVNTKYPLTKLDFVALPSLEKNVISSLGLISLKISFLMDQKSTTTEENQLSTMRIAEAIVQQFFGGITSSSSLKDNIIWDGLVKYLAISILSSLKQHWPLKEMYILHLSSKTMDTDAMQGWSSIINSTSIYGQKDEFYIDKTVAVFDMLHATLGETRFKKCLGNFVRENYFKTNDIKNVWSTCNKSRDLKPLINIEEMMSLWMNQQGYPLVNVSRSENNVTLSQAPFEPVDSEILRKNYLNKNSNDDESATDKKHPTKNVTRTRWSFPVTYVTNKNNTAVQVWMDKPEVSFQVPADVKWIKLNSGQTGFYRVTYSTENWNYLIQELVNGHERYRTEDRVGLLSDGFTLCHANAISCDIIMKMITYLPKEKKWGPVTLALRHLEKWRRILKYSECFLMLSEFIKIQLRAIVEQIGLQDTGEIETKMLRPGVLLALILWEDNNIIDKSKEIFKNFLENQHETISTNLREAIYTGAIISGEYSYWQFCWERFLRLQQTPGNYTERMQLVRALGRTKDVWLQNRLLSHITLLPTAELVEVLQSIAGTPVGGAIACRFLQANWFDLQSRLGKGTVGFAKVISIITQYGATNFDFDELNSLVYRFGDGPGLKILQMTVRTVASNVEWVKNAQSSLYTWVEQNLH